MKLAKIFLAILFLFLTSYSSLLTSNVYAQVPSMTTPQAIVATSGMEYQPFIIEDAAGRIRVFATGPGNADINNPENYKLFMATYSSGTNSFGTPSQVTNLTRVVGVTGANDSSGVLHLIIEKYTWGEAGRYDLYWTSNSGSGWATPQRLTTHEGADIQPTLVEIGNGNLALVFVRKFIYDVNGNTVATRSDPNYAYTSSDLYETRYINGSWTTPSPLAVTPFYSEMYPSVVKGPSNNYYLIYSTNEEGTWSVIARSYSQGAWSSSQIIESGIDNGMLQQVSIVNDSPGKYRLVFAKRNLCPNSLCPNLASDYTSEIRYKTYDASLDSWSASYSLTGRSQFYADKPSALYASNGTYWLVFRRISDLTWGANNVRANFDIYWMKSL